MNRQWSQKKLLHALVAEQLKWLHGPATLAAVVGGTAEMTWEGMMLRNIPPVLVDAIERTGRKICKVDSNTYLIDPPRT